MATVPTLNLDNVVPDPHLVERVPPALALYYLALPLAQEDGRISLAMAYPENTTALAVLSRLLDATIVPVRCAAESIRSRLQKLAPQSEPPAASILALSGSPEREDAVTRWAKFFGAALEASVLRGDGGDVDVDSSLNLLQKRGHRLTVFALPPHAPLADVMKVAQGPLFLVRGVEITPLRRILVVLRGFSSDEQSIRWATSCASGPATLTLLRLNSGQTPGIRAVSAVQMDRWSTPTNPPGTVAVQACLKVRQGELLRQIGDEAAEGNYDLVVVSAEGDGAFVARALAELDLRNVHSGRPVLVLKPPLSPIHL